MFEIQKFQNIIASRAIAAMEQKVNAALGTTNNSSGNGIFKSDNF